LGKRYEIIDRILEIEIYVYIVFMFLTKGEGIRNILLFSAFLFWLSTLKHRENKWVLKTPVFVLFWIYIGTITVSAIFSIDPGYSFFSLAIEPLKAIIILCLLSTVLADENRLKRFVYVLFFILVFTISLGYYSYWAYDLTLMKPVTWIRHAWHNRFAMDINTLLPFTLILLLTAKDLKMKIVVVVVIVAAVTALILSTSKGGLAAFFSMLVIWGIYFSVRHKLNKKLVISFLIFISLVIGTISYFSLPEEKLATLKHDITTLTRRTKIWGPLVHAALQRPITGWGYGSRIFTLDKPFESTPFKVAPVQEDSDFRNPHNAFLRIFFHQGVVGLIPYIAMIGVSAVSFWRGACNSQNLHSFVLAACASILVGIYFVNSIVENPHLTDVAFTLGIGLAAGYTESSKSLTH